MAILKIMNKPDIYTHKGSYKDDNARQNVFDYIFDSYHAGNSSKLRHYLVGGSPNVDMNDPVGSMAAVAQYFHKDYGIRLKHLVLSFSEDDFVSSSMACMAAQFISEQIGVRFQNVFAVHEDTDNVHVHFLMNTVSFIDGYKYKYQCDKPILAEICKEATRQLDVDSFSVTGR